jgi:hypothetical protein
MLLCARGTIYVLGRNRRSRARVHLKVLIARAIRHVITGAKLDIRREIVRGSLLREGLLPLAPQAALCSSFEVV